MPRGGHEVRREPLSFLLFLLLAAATPLGASADAETVDYVALPHVVGVSCSADTYTLFDIGDAQPGPPPDPIRWLLQYEHECTVSEAKNVVREETGAEPRGTAHGAYAFRFAAEDIGTLATAVPHDLAFGAFPPVMIVVRTLAREDPTVEGCGPQSLMLPDDPEPHSIWNDYRFWVWVHPAYVGEDLDVCFGTAGELHGSWGAT